ncbi:MAG: radical SAM protein [Chloroflexi bacterium]|nr:MAG: radical SAM protein [Chloroflexota bacterium]MBL1194118.1 radical SAM protein [Chloroflexota bacterium]NOH11411.1 radical SAM protein [Chloroflexota bacterium]
MSRIKEIEAKTLLSHHKEPDPWFGIKYGMNLYRGCQHRCIYCDSRSLCYGVEDFDREVLVKTNAIEKLEKELASKRVKGTVGTGSMNDPYMPIEKKLNLTGRALKIIAALRFPVHVITKSNLVLKDLETLQQINQVYAAVSFSITTSDDTLAKKVEPGAPPTSARLAAMAELASHGILTGVTMMPILPFIEDNKENVTEIIKKATENGASYIIPWFGMSMRDRQRDYFYEQLDRHFPGMKEKYQQRYGQNYGCPTPNANHLQQVFDQTCQQYNMPARMPFYQKDAAEQLQMF